MFGLLGGWDDPRRQALLMAAAAALQPGAGGTSGAAGRAMQAGLMGYNQAGLLADRRKQEEQERAFRDMQMGQLRQQDADRKSIADIYSRNTMPGNLTPNDDMGNPMPAAPQGVNLPGLMSGLQAAGPAGMREAAAVQGMMPKPKPFINAAPGTTIWDPNTQQPVFQAPEKTPDWKDPEYQDFHLRKAREGRPQMSVKVDSYLPASEAAQTEFMRSTRQNYEALRNAPVALENIEKAKQLIPAARGFMGPGGEGMLEAAKFLNTRFGMSINTKGVKDAEELRTRIFQNVLDNLKKMDAQPSEMQQRVMQDALGRLGTDPNALPDVLDSFGEIIRGKVEIHNREVAGAEARGVKFPYNPIIEMRRSRSQPSNDPLVLEIGGQQVRFPSEQALRAYKKQVGRQ